MPRITVLPAGLTATVTSGELLFHAGRQAGAVMKASCFSCFCGTCVVKVSQGLPGLSEPSQDELEVLQRLRTEPQTHRLACCAKLIRGEVVIEQEDTDEIEPKSRGDQAVL
jgi:ferredoxin